jgi:monofunctional biosynthetic peptidoglycan transglycosylase
MASRPREQKRLQELLKWGSKLFFKLSFGLLILSMSQVFLLRFTNPPCTASMGWRWLESKARGKYYRKPHGQWRCLDDISPHLRRAVLAGEDQRFLLHRGFDFIEMNKAIRDVFVAGRLRGASTITMQVARTVFLWPGRSWFRKVFEAYYTILIESFWTKKRILEVYLNTVDWGTGIMGAESASKKYFHTGSDQISPPQAALLCAILPRPHVWSPTNPDRHVRLRQQRILRDMWRMPLI